MTGRKESCNEPAERQILVVEDEALVRGVLERAFSLAGLDAVFAASGAEALAAIAEHGHFSVVLLDVSLPDALAEDLLAQLREACPCARVLLMSGLARAELEGRFSGREVNGMLHKPFQLDELLGRLHSEIAAS